jgi:dTDP-4-dehydrorhamnose reductase
MRIAIIGANGQLGTDLVPRFRPSGEVVALARSDADVRDADQLRAVLGDSRPDIVINTAAFHKVDACEDDPWQAIEVNTLGTLNVARVCRELDAKLVHLSTDYVFSGRSQEPYAESDPPEPINVYGASKLAGERAALDCWARTIVVRTSGLFGMAGASGKGGNFIETMLRLGQSGEKVRVVNDQTLSPTSTADLATAIYEITKRSDSGIFHVTNSGSCTWFEFARSIFKLARMDVDLEKSTSDAFGARARRPSFSVLANEELKKLGIVTMPTWEDALERYLRLRAQPPN